MKDQEEISVSKIVFVMLLIALLVGIDTWKSAFGGS